MKITKTIKSATAFLLSAALLLGAAPMLSAKAAQEDLTTVSAAAVTAEVSETATQSIQTETQPQTEAFSAETATEEPTESMLPNYLDELDDDEDSYLWGDADGSGKITIADTIILQKYIARLTNLSDNLLIYCDVNNSGKTDIQDIVIIQRYLAKAVSKLPYDAAAEALIARNISLNTQSIRLQPTESTQLSAVVLPSTAIYSLQWRSGDTSIATVDENGVVTAVANGKTFITAVTDKGISASCFVNVVTDPTQVTIAATSVTLDKNQTFALNATVLPECEQGNIVYFSSNIAVATVDENGIITANAAGTSTVTATTYNGKTAICNVTVILGKISLDITEKAAGALQSFDLTAIVSDTTATTIAWASSNTAVAQITANENNACTVKAIGAGTAQLTATLPNGARATCTLTVQNAPTYVNLNISWAKLVANEYYSLSKVIPAGSFDAFKYTSSNPDIVTVNASTGLIMPKKAGKATVTVTMYNDISDSCTITVENSALAKAAYAQIGNGPQKYRTWFYGNKALGVPWCAVFVSWASRCNSSLAAVVPVTDGAGCFAREGVANGWGQWFEEGTSPNLGDIITFCWNGKGSYMPWQDKYYSDHVGVVTGVTDKEVITTEGNASSDKNNTSNDATTVMRRIYAINSKYINGYYRPNFVG